MNQVYYNFKYLTIFIKKQELPFKEDKIFRQIKLQDKENFCVY